MIKTREQLGLFITEKEIANKIKDSQERRIAFAERKNIAYDALKPVIKAKLNSIFSVETYQDSLPYMDVSSNIFKRVMNEISTVYNYDPTREISPKSAGKVYDEISGVEGFNINGKLQKYNYLLSSLNDLALQVIVVDGKIDITAITPDRLIIFSHPAIPTIVEALLIEDAYYDANGMRQSQWIFWSPVRHFIVRGDANQGMMKIVGVNDNPELLNPYGKINEENGSFYPFIFCHASERDESFFDENSGSDLVEATKMVCIQKTFRNMMIPMQFKQIAVNKPMDDGSTLKNMQLKSPLHVFQSNGDITVLDWQSDIEKLGREIQNYVFEVSASYGVSQDNFKLTAQPQSGFALKISKERLIEIRDAQEKIWRKIESDLFLAIAFATQLYPDFKSIPDSAKFSIDYAENEMAEDPIIELDVLERKIQLGVISLIDVAKKFNPDIATDEQAIELLKKNAETKRKIENRLGLGNLTLNGGANGEGRRQAIQDRISGQD